MLTYITKNLVINTHTYIINTQLFSWKDALKPLMNYFYYFWTELFLWKIHYTVHIFSFWHEMAPLDMWTISYFIQLCNIFSLWQASFFFHVFFSVLWRRMSNMEYKRLAFSFLSYLVLLFSIHILFTTFLESFSRLLK